ncbi:MAG: glycosyltransferase family 2 protein [Planctomycetota bacterium]
MTDLRSTTDRPADLSVAIVCRNNADTIGRVLKSCRGVASQLVVVDSGSTDGTLGLLDACRDWCEVVLLETAWRGHIATKQLALEACTRRHALALDSDEPMTPELARSVAEACARDLPAARVNRVVEYRGRLLTRCWQPEWRLRLVRTDLVRDARAAWGGLDPHDKLEVADVPVEDLSGTLIHESFPSFERHLANQLKLQAVAARSNRAAGKAGSRVRLATSPPGAFFKQLVLKGSWRDGRAGWLAAGTAAAGALMKHMILLELDDAGAGSDGK